MQNEYCAFLHFINVMVGKKSVNITTYERTPQITEVKKATMKSTLNISTYITLMLWSKSRQALKAMSCLYSGPAAEEKQLSSAAAA